MMIYLTNRWEDNVLLWWKNVELEALIGHTICGLLVFFSLFFTNEFLHQNYRVVFPPVVHTYHEFGPNPYFTYESFEWENTKSAFSSMDLSRLREFSPEELKESIVAGIYGDSKTRASSYFHRVFKMAEKYRIDPFWAFSILWTESHFRPYVMSAAKAQGLMQILPGTGKYLLRKLKRKVSLQLAIKITRDPYQNIELGVYYLSRLLKRFDGNFIHATAAYNLGPTRVERRLARGLEVGNKNHYVNKVKRYYFRASKKTFNFLKKNAPAWEKTYVARHPRWFIHNFFDKKIAFSSSILTDSV